MFAWEMLFSIIKCYDMLLLCDPGLVLFEMICICGPPKPNIIQYYINRPHTLPDSFSGGRQA